MGRDSVSEYSIRHPILFSTVSSIHDRRSVSSQSSGDTSIVYKFLNSFNIKQYFFIKPCMSKLK